MLKYSLDLVKQNRDTLPIVLVLIVVGVSLIIVGVTFPTSWSISPYQTCNPIVSSDVNTIVVPEA